MPRRTNSSAKLEARVEELERQLRELIQKDVGGARERCHESATVDTPTIQTKPITPNATAGTRFLYSGFVKLDALWSDYRDGEIADGRSIGRDFYLPSTIPVGGVSEGVDFRLSHQAGRVSSSAPTRTCWRLLSTRLKWTCMAPRSAMKRATNTYGVQVRHAYIQYGRWQLARRGPTSWTRPRCRRRRTSSARPTARFSCASRWSGYTLGNWSGLGGKPRDDDHSVPRRHPASLLDTTTMCPISPRPTLGGSAMGRRRAVKALVRQLRYETTVPVRGRDSSNTRCN